MWKWVKRLILAAVLIGVGFTAYDSYKYGYHTRPKMPDGAFSLSYKSGLRGILVDVPDEKENRRYLGYPMDVPFYLKESWSFCRPPQENEKAQASEFMEKRDWPGERFEAVCKIDVDNKTVIRGLITSVPRI